jgi:pimeloyl-ACP methyl ester carboxylesterase
MIPRPGETGDAWWTDTGQVAAQREYLASLGLDPGAVRDPAVLYFHDVPRETTVEAFQGGEPPQSMTPMRQPWPLKAWPAVPTRDLAGRNDRLLPLAFQRRIARERLGLAAEEIEGGHLLALSPPRELAERLESYRAGIGRG